MQLSGSQQELYNLAIVLELAKIDIETSINLHPDVIKEMLSDISKWQETARLAIDDQRVDDSALPFGTSKVHNEVDIYSKSINNALMNLN